MIEMRCRKCKRLLAKEDMVVGTIEIKCQCGVFNSLTVDKMNYGNLTARN